MKRPFTVRVLTSLMEAVLPRDIGEVAVGDLNEEFLLRAEATSAGRATTWFAGQAAGSTPRLLWLSAKRMSWLLSLAVAAGAFYLLGLIEPYLHRALDAVIDPTFFWLLIADLAVGFTACACGGFLATALRRGSAMLYSLIGTAYIVSGLPDVGPDIPAWFVAAFIAVAFVAPLTGGIAFVALSHRFSQWHSHRGGRSR